MAGVTRGRKDGTWKAWYWDRKSKKQAWVPAEVVNEWDGLSREEAQRRLDQWAAQNGVARIRSARRTALASSEVRALIAAFLEDVGAQGGTGAETLQNTAAHLNNYALEYFVQTHALQDVRLWYQHTPQFLVWLRTTYPDLRTPSVKRVCQTLRRFGEFLTDAGLLHQPWRIKMPKRRPGEHDNTPLPRAVAPEEILKASEQLPPRWALMVLLGFFASLSPHEIYGLKREDFITGKEAKKEAKTYDRFQKQGLGSGLSIHVRRGRPRQGLGNLKTRARLAVVNVWDVEAAKRVAALLKPMEGYLFPEGRDVIDEEYRVHVKPLLEIVAYDLRRASGLYLGREKGVDPFLLQDHMRHASLSTTLRYTRRPVTAEESASTQNLDDVS